MIDICLNRLFLVITKLYPSSKSYYPYDTCPAASGPYPACNLLALSVKQLKICAPKVSHDKSDPNLALSICGKVPNIFFPIYTRHNLTNGQKGNSSLFTKQQIRHLSDQGPPA